MGKLIYKSLPDMSKARNRVDNPKVIFDEVKVGPHLAKFAKGKKYVIKTFGCQANVRDEEILSGYLEKAGFIKTDNDREADLAIINTCAVRENAEEKVYGEIGKFKVNKTNNKDFILCVCGCMMQEEGSADYIMKTYPHVSLVFGTHNVNKILDLLEEKIARNKKLVDVYSFAGDVIENLPSVRLDPYKAYVNITYGCDKFCTYCIVPYTRGRERSRKLEEIVNECKELVAKGYQEITLLGQNVNSYGKDFHDGTNFSKVLEEVAKLGIPRLRFMTSHPWDFSNDMLEIIAKYPNIMKCIHLPVQSGSTSVLRLMGRRYSREEYLDLVDRIRKTIPGVALTTDIIVGFPNETEEEFEDTLTLCEKVQYDSAFTFIYSPRKGTPAAKMIDNVSDKEKHDRFVRLVKVIEDGVSKHAESMVGKTYKVLVDGPSKKDKGVLSGYTESSKLVNFKGPSFLKGHIVNVYINESHTYSLIGTLVDDPILVLASSLKEKIEKEDSYIRYIECKNVFESSSFLKQLKEEMEEKQKQLVNKSFKTDEDLLPLKKEIDELKKAYFNDPVYLNLQSSIADLSSLLEQIKDNLE
ncbi:MAG: tRNA (N6-isopentenyl adenosine(37)-C2)-methylthiotransferase MiaB [Candidatus Enteromonas sp.]|nr:tRNA (N6-isopentenyl adenosine(37)-C2)-methylthiotransferase MiaB [Candidatus Enteromonas sp.]MDY4936434.1 tRNA (N6-isopentenyl adenosine(37)-C2)-methylthiotransferase MiaB [Candidatus Enteromonas sp.]